VKPDHVHELVELWKRRLSGDESIGLLRKNGGIQAWYRRLATVPSIASAVAAELGGEPEHAIEVEHLGEFLAAMELPANERRARLSALELDGPSEWAEAVAFCDLARGVALRFDAWLARARELEEGPRSTPVDPLGVGAHVEHSTFGRGVVRAKLGDILTIEFDGAEKRVHARFVRPSPSEP
jgi:hypothetical protein